jgi:hypothetical protein
MSRFLLVPCAVPESYQQADQYRDNPPGHPPRQTNVRNSFWRFPAIIGHKVHGLERQREQMNQTDLMELAALQRCTRDFIRQITSMFPPDEAAELIRAMADRVEAAGTEGHPEGDIEPACGDGFLIGTPSIVAGKRAGLVRRGWVVGTPVRLVASLGRVRGPLSAAGSGRPAAPALASQYRPARGHGLEARVEAHALGPVDVQWSPNSERFQPPNEWKAIGTGIGTLMPTMPTSTRLRELAGGVAVAGEDGGAVAVLVLVDQSTASS